MPVSAQSASLSGDRADVNAAGPAVEDLVGKVQPSASASTKNAAPTSANAEVPHRSMREPAVEESAEHTQVFSQLLREIVTNYGQVWAEPARLRGLLNDLAPLTDRLQVAVLVAACEEGIVRELSALDRRHASAFVEQLALRLRTRRAIELGWARWAVETWVEGLNDPYVPDE